MIKHDAFTELKQPVLTGFHVRDWYSVCVCVCVGGGGGGLHGIPPSKKAQFPPKQSMLVYNYNKDSTNYVISPVVDTITA